METKSEIQNLAGTEVTLVIPNTESLGKLKEMAPQFSLNMRYKTADDWASVKDKPMRVFYMGQKAVPNDDGELITCGVFVSEKEVFIAGQMVLVEAVKSLPEKTPLEITYRGKKDNKSSQGTTMLFDVIKLG